MESLKINNYAFAFIEKGQGRPVVFVHGTLNDYRAWQDQVAYFAQNYRTFSYSRRNHYPNDTHDISEEYVVDKHAEDLLALLQKLELEDVTLIGNSYGAYVILVMAIKYPQRVKSLVLCEPPVISFLVTDPENPLHLIALLLRDFRAGKGFIQFGLKTLIPAKRHLKMGNHREAVRIFTNGVLGEGSYARLAPGVRDLLLDNAPALEAELLGPGFPRDFPKAKAASLDVPVLLLNGENSPVFFHSITKKLNNILPDSRSDIIAKASHDMHHDQPEAFNRRVGAFLK